MNLLRLQFMSYLRILLLLVALTSFTGRASHVMGGDISWWCQGGDYVFQLVFYRDCNGTDVNTVSENLRVWNHPTESQITLNYISRTDISPLCTQVAGGPAPLDCGVGAQGGNGTGAIEKVVYQSAPITLGGTPPPEGWIFTYENFSRSGTIVNLQNASTYGITLKATIYDAPNSTGGCVDNSPLFLQDPYFVSCVGDPYEYNMNAVDPDLDSLVISFGQPMDHYSINGPYDPPNNPVPIPYETGFSVNSPTPGPSMNAGNIPAALDPSSGNLTFLSNNTGSYAVKVVAQEYRYGVLIGEVEREIQLIILACAGNNNAPVIAGPFGGLFKTTINAGDPISFNLTSTDVELLQDGSPQSNIITPTGLMFGSPYTNNTGCLITPCATLSSNPPITGNQGATVTFDWQTSCDHLVNPYGYSLDMVPYHFVFKVQDDYCQVPKVSYATITINVVNPGVIQAPPIDCIQADAANNITINWTPVTDPFGTFVEYEVHSVQGGLLGTVPAIGTGSLTIPGAATSVSDYFLAVVSGCNGNTTRYSDTISNIFLAVSNPSNGTAILQWNDPIQPALSSMGSYYQIYREYPTNVWTLIDSVPYGTTNFLDTIDICSAFLNYQIVLPNTPCNFTSNIDGDNFEDMMTPDIPIITNVTIDTLTNQVIINWNENGQDDTYGYVIYSVSGGVPVEIDTVWGISNTTYTYSTSTDSGPLSYTVAAFDSCWTTNVPPTYQTSAKAETHTTNYLTSSVNICDRTVTLDWTGYIGWTSVEEYRVYGYKSGGSWSMFGTSTTTSLTVPVDAASDYCFVVEAISPDSVSSFSNISCIYVAIPGQPEYNYLQVATVSSDKVVLRYMVDNSVSIPKVIIQRKIDGDVFENLDTVAISTGSFTYVDSNELIVDELSYVYRVQIVDSCNHPGAYSNEAQTILLKVISDDVMRINQLNWNPYHEFNGSITAYNVYRGINGVFNPTPIDVLPNFSYSYEDDVNSVVSTGKICYKVEAVESMNIYSISERSMSNIACAVLEPLIYIPNAFMPEGINKVFKPVITDFDPADYQFTIFSRWGEVMFRTDDYSEGWTGVIQGTNKMAANDTYLFMLEVHDGNGVEIIRRGHVSLIN